MSYPEFDDFCRNTRSFSDLAAMDYVNAAFAKVRTYRSNSASVTKSTAISSAFSAFRIPGTDTELSRTAHRQA
jgi:hypothetical protein